MLKLSCHLSKKCPIPGQPFSSQQFSAGIECEASDTEDAAAIQRRLQGLYALLGAAVDRQIADAGAVAGPVSAGSTGPSQEHRPAPQARTPRVPQDGGNGNGRARRNGQPVMATAAQARAIRSIASEQGLDLAEVLAPYGVTDPAALSIRDASTTIDALKARKGNGARR